MEVFWQPLNLIDLASVAPFYIQLAFNNSSNSRLQFLRIIRLSRVFRLFKVGKYNEIFFLFSRVMNRSVPALYVLIFLFAFILIIYASIIFYCEGGQWYPPGSLINGQVIHNGGFYRNAVNAQSPDDLEPTPFYSITACFWYVIVTCTTGTLPYIKSKQTHLYIYFV